MGELIARADNEILERILWVKLNSTFRFYRAGRSDGLGHCSCVRRRRGGPCEYNERDGRLASATGGRHGFSKERSIMLTEPVTKKLIGNAYLRCTVFYPFKPDGHKPGVIDLL